MLKGCRICFLSYVESCVNAFCFHLKGPGRRGDRTVPMNARLFVFLLKSLHRFLGESLQRELAAAWTRRAEAGSLGRSR